MTRNKKNSPDKNLSNSTENQKTDREMIMYLVDKIDSFGQTLKDLKDIIDRIKLKTEENNELKKRVETYESEINNLEQRSRMINITINGIQQKGNENVLKIVEEIGRKLGFVKPLEDVQAAHRVNSMNKKKPKPIIVRLLNTKTRDKWTAAYRQKKLWHENFYINEHLTRRNQELLYQTKQLARKKNYRYVWTHDCKILIRKNENSKAYAIKNLDQLENILGIKKIPVIDLENEDHDITRFYETINSNHTFDNSSNFE
ncbi:uncharacterized protein LOC113467137 [Diaphorina citri]|uniref:Uncharacterized protein LOC113467137 n=1 Tax=Diaphorina citri TaxID=121845 RepID=A0A3Q0IRP3_DIACI|nr:uncharacterized protein LOC113467137 [Diaphorina citri]